MFENIIGQEATVARLRRELEAGTLPSSILLHGPAYSGKLSTALEVARALTCEAGNAQWNCTCRSCESQRLLSHPDTLLMGPRYFATEIAASGDVLARLRRPASQYLYLRAVRKLLRRFDPTIWEGSEAKRSAAQSAIAEIDDRIADLAPERSLPSEGPLTKSIKSVNERSTKLAAVLPDTIPINQVRKAVYWAHTTGQGRAKIAIIESADRMLDSARNALLKILEEPPRGVYFILTSQRRGAIIPTLLSRLRPYHLPARSAERDREVLAKIFREENPSYGSLKDYFLAWNDTDAELLRTETRRFLEGVFAGIDGGPPDPELLSFLAGRSVFAPFLEQLGVECAALLRQGDHGSAEVERLSAFSRYIRECASRSEQFNQSPSLLLESLFYRMRKEA